MTTDCSNHVSGRKVYSGGSGYLEMKGHSLCPAAQMCNSGQVTIKEVSSISFPDYSGLVSQFCLPSPVPYCTVPKWKGNFSMAKQALMDQYGYFVDLSSSLSGKVQGTHMVSLPGKRTKAVLPINVQAKIKHYLPEELSETVPKVQKPEKRAKKHQEPIHAEALLGLTVNCFYTNVLDLNTAHNRHVLKTYI